MLYSRRHASTHTLRRMGACSCSEPRVWCNGADARGGKEHGASVFMPSIAWRGWIRRDQNLSVVVTAVRARLTAPRHGSCCPSPPTVRSFAKKSRRRGRRSSIDRSVSFTTSRCSTPETACVDRQFFRPASVEAEKIGSFGRTILCGCFFSCITAAGLRCSGRHANLRVCGDVRVSSRGCSVSRFHAPQ